MATAGRRVLLLCASASMIQERAAAMRAFRRRTRSSLCDVSRQFSTAMSGFRLALIRRRLPSWSSFETMPRHLYSLCGQWTVDWEGFLVEFRFHFPTALRRVFGSSSKPTRSRDNSRSRKTFQGHTTIPLSRESGRRLAYAVAGWPQTCRRPFENRLRTCSAWKVVSWSKTRTNVSKNLLDWVFRSKELWNTVFTDIIDITWTWRVLGSMCLSVISTCLFQKPKPPAVDQGTRAIFTNAGKILARNLLPDPRLPNFDWWKSLDKLELR